MGVPRDERCQIKPCVDAWLRIDTYISMPRSMTPEERRVTGPALELLTQMCAAERQWRETDPALADAVERCRRTVARSCNERLASKGVGPLPEVE